ncbi:hypothetical protein LC55x_2219 [Lysobacter capsici]|nr:hypothetical protein LC55x_2219 [Lysobacter capsici]
MPPPRRGRRRRLTQTHRRATTGAIGRAFLPARSCFSLVTPG